MDAMLHDIGDTLAANNHPEIGAATLKPSVSEEIPRIVKHHGIFQGDYFWHHIDMDRDAREACRGHEFFDACAESCERCDQAAFEPAGETLPLDEFEAMVKRVLNPESGILGGASESRTPRPRCGAPGTF